MNMIRLLSKLKNVASYLLLGVMSAILVIITFQFLEATISGRVPPPKNSELNHQPFASLHANKTESDAGAHS